MTATPDGLSVSSTINGLCLKVNWNGISDGESYKLYRSEIQYGDFSLITTLAYETGLTYYDKPPLPNDNFRNMWWYKVSAVIGLTESTLSGPTTYYNYGAFDNKPLPHASWSALM